MREQLTQYVELLFAGTDAEDIKQEILQNTLDRYDDLVADGKVPEAAYRLAIAGIGDVNEILGTPVSPAVTPRQVVDADDGDTPKKKLLRAIAVGLYILCPLPLFIFTEMGNPTIGLCGTLVIVAVATVLIMLGARKDIEKQPGSAAAEIPPRKRVQKRVWTIGIVLFVIVSLQTQAWGATWLLLPATAVAEQLVYAILDYMEVLKGET